MQSEHSHSGEDGSGERAPRPEKPYHEPGCGNEIRLVLCLVIEEHDIKKHGRKHLTSKDPVPPLVAAQEKRKQQNRGADELDGPVRPVKPEPLMKDTHHG